jgi:hypothetical protein
MWQVWIGLELNLSFDKLQNTKNKLLGQNWMPLSQTSCELSRPPKCTKPFLICEVWKTSLMDGNGTLSSHHQPAPVSPSM